MPGAAFGLPLKEKRTVRIALSADGTSSGDALILVHTANGSAQMPTRKGELRQMYDGHIEINNARLHVVQSRTGRDDA